MSKIQYLKNLSQIAEKYDVFFIDLWGVIHDGMVAYPGVNDALFSLKNSGKKLIFISNAPRRSSNAIEGLRKVGVPDDLYDAVITSGEMVFDFLNLTPPLNIKTKKYIIIGPDRDAGLLANTDYIPVLDVQDAEFMVVTGFDHDDSAIDEKQHYLDAAIKLNIPLLCANPDLVIVRQNGQRALCAGEIAKKYEQMGGQVLQFGKPYAPVYERAMEMAGMPIKGRVAAIGDSLITDILGANNFCIDSYFIPGGIYGAELGIKHGQLPEEGRLAQLCEDYKITPTGALPEFVF